MLEKNKFQLRREATYAKLVQAGLEVLCEKGYSGASIDDIVERAGFTKGAFYVHFETKEQFLINLLKFRKKSRADLLAPFMALTESNDSLDIIIYQLMDKMIDHLKKTPEWILVYVDFFMQAKHNEEAMTTYQNYYNDWISEIQNFISQLIAKELLPQETNALEKAKMFYAFMDGCLLHYNFYKEMLNPSQMAEGFLAILKS